MEVTNEHTSLESKNLSTIEHLISILLLRFPYTVVGVHDLFESTKPDEKLTSSQLEQCGRAIRFAQLCLEMQISKDVLILQEFEQYVSTHCLTEFICDGFYGQVPSLFKLASIAALKNAGESIPDFINPVQNMRLPFVQYNSYDVTFTMEESYRDIIRTILSGLFQGKQYDLMTVATIVGDIETLQNCTAQYMAHNDVLSAMPHREFNESCKLKKANQLLELAILNNQHDAFNCIANLFDIHTHAAFLAVHLKQYFFLTEDLMQKCNLSHFNAFLKEYYSYETWTLGAFSSKRSNKILFDVQSDTVLEFLALIGSNQTITNSQKDRIINTMKISSGRQRFDYLPIDNWTINFMWLVPLDALALILFLLNSMSMLYNSTISSVNKSQAEAKDTDPTRKTSHAINNAPNEPWVLKRDSKATLKLAITASRKKFVSDFMDYFTTQTLCYNNLKSRNAKYNRARYINYFIKHINTPQERHDQGNPLVTTFNLDNNNNEEEPPVQNEQGLSSINSDALALGAMLGMARKMMLINEANRRGFYRGFDRLFSRRRELHQEQRLPNDETRTHPYHNGAIIRRDNR